MASGFTREKQQIFFQREVTSASKDNKDLGKVQKSM